MGSNEEDLLAARAIPGLVPELMNVRPGISCSFGEIEVEIPEGQRQPGARADPAQDLSPGNERVGVRPSACCG